AVLGRLTTGQSRAFLLVPCNTGEKTACRQATAELASTDRAPDSGKSPNITKDRLMRLLLPRGVSRLRQDRKRTSPGPTTSGNTSATAAEVTLSSVPTVSLSPMSLTFATQALGT